MPKHHVPNRGLSSNQEKLSSPSVEGWTDSPRPSTGATASDSRVRPLGLVIVACALILFAFHISDPRHAFPLLSLLFFLVWRYEAMNSPVVHYSLFIIALPELVRLRPLVPIKLAVAFTPWTLFPGLVAIGLHPASTAGTAVNPTGEGLAK